MKRFPLVCAVLALTALLSACGRSSPAAEDSIQTIRSLEDAQNRDFNTRDLNSLLACYADNAVMISPGQPTASGKPAIQASLRQLTSDPAFSLHFRTGVVRVAASDDLAYSQGTYALTVTNPTSHKPMVDRGSYVTTYGKQANGSWEILTDIITSQSHVSDRASGD